MAARRRPAGGEGSAGRIEPAQEQGTKEDFEETIVMVGLEGAKSDGLAIEEKADVDCAVGMRTPVAGR